MRPNLTVTTAAASRSLCTLANVKAELGITGSGSDAKLGRLIVATSMAMAGPAGLRREPWLQAYSEKLAGPGGHYLILSRWPVKANPVITEGTGSSPTTVDATTYSVALSSRRDRVYRVNGWTHTRHDVWRPFSDSDGPDLVYTATYSAGWIMPDELTEWSAGASVAASEWFKSTDDDEPFIFQADATGGTTDSAEPTWPTVHEGTVTDNDVTWTAYDMRLPQDLEEAAMVQVIDWFGGGLNIPSGIKSEAFEGSKIEYLTGTVAATALAPHVQATCRGYR